MGLLSNSAAVNNELPSSNAVAEALDLPVQDGKGDQHSLRSLIEGYRRSVVIFVRHNHCGACMRFVALLGENAALKATTTDESPRAERTKVVVIGHGSYEGIGRYKEVSEMPFDMYVDSTKRVQKALGMNRRYLGKPKNEQPEYFNDESATFVAWTSFKELLTSGHLAWKGGDFAFLGGDFVFDQDLRCIFVHRMQDTQDHAAVAKLAEFVEPKPQTDVDSKPGDAQSQSIATVAAQ